MISGWGLHSGVLGKDGEDRNEENRKKFVDSKLGLVRFDLFSLVIID